MLARRATIRKPARRQAKRTGSVPSKSLGTLGNGSKLTTFAVHRATTPTTTRVSFTSNTATCSIGNSTDTASPGLGPTTPVPNEVGSRKSLSPPKSSLHNPNYNKNRTSIGTSGNVTPQRPSLFEAYAILKVSIYHIALYFILTTEISNILSHIHSNDLTS